MKTFFCFIALLLCSYSLIIAQETAEDAPEDRKPLIPLTRPLFGEDDRLDLDFGVDFGVTQASFWNKDTIRMNYLAGPFSLVADLSMNNDQKYAPNRVLLPRGDFFGFYFFMNEGGLSYSRGPLSLRGGRFRVYDIVDSPYSLFVNSLGHSANTLELDFETPRFIYQTQWIEATARNSVSSPAWNEYYRRKGDGPDDFLAPPNPNPSNDTSDLQDFGFPDRGVNYKIYGLKVKDWRIGFLDAAVYTGRSFDLEYFLNPIPQYFIQYAKGIPGRPWATASNENSLIGLFWDIDKPQWSAYTQVLVDDFSLGFLRFIYSGFSPNPWKAAWALGGRLETPYGRFGLHHGGALKYTFEPIETDGGGKFKNDSAVTAYGYTYYPETRYFDDEDGGTLVNILIQDTMIGYKYGENNIAFQVDYQNTFYEFLVNAELELVLAGNNSPANPWHHYDSRSNLYNDKEGSSLLDDDNLEKVLELRLRASRKLGAWTFFTALALGGRFNKLILVPAERDPYTKGNGDRTIDDDIWIWKASNEHELILRFSLGAKFTLGVL
jgi:hypothetical protein